MKISDPLYSTVVGRVCQRRHVKSGVEDAKDQRLQIRVSLGIVAYSSGELFLLL